MNVNQTLTSVTVEEKNEEEARLHVMRNFRTSNSAIFVVKGNDGTLNTIMPEGLTHFTVEKLNY